MSRRRQIRAHRYARQRIVRRRSQPEPARSFHDDLPSPVLQLQRALGNQRVAQLIQAGRLTPQGKTIFLRPKSTVGGPLIQRDRRRSEEESKNVAPNLAAFDAANPGIIAALSFEQLKVWHDIIAGWAHNRKVSEALVRHEKRERSKMLDPTSTRPIISSAYLDERARIESRRKFVDEGKSRVPIAHAAILSPEITAPQAWNVDAEHRYRSWAVEYFSSKSLEAELTSKRELVSALEESQHPGLSSGIPHVNLLWAGHRIRHTRGIVTWNDLMDIKEFSDRYIADVSDGPGIRALRDGIRELDSHITQMKIEHYNRSEANARQRAVRHVSEFLSAPSWFELTMLRIKVQQNPGDLDAKAALAEKEAEAGNYPKLKDNAEGPGIWHDPDLQLAAARRFMKEGKFELAVAALTECEHSTVLATAKFAGYERRVTKGASVAIKWLERAKTAGKIASAFTGTGGVVRAAVGAAGYSFAQEGSQQVVASWIDPSNKIDLKGLTQRAAIDGLATLFGGITQGAFVKALTARFGARLITKYGLSEGAARSVLSAASATTASFYNVPAKIVLEKIITGKAVPSSLAEVCDMVTTEAVQSGLLDAAGSYIHAQSAKSAPAPEPAVPRTGPEIAAPHTTVESLAGAEGAQLMGPRPAPSIGGGVGAKTAEPTTIIAEARQIAGLLEPLRHDWSKLSAASRAQRLVDGVHQALATTGVPKPAAILQAKRGGLFEYEIWVIKLEKSLLSKKDVTLDEFAAACELARHEMEHALQFFRIARREHARSGEDAKTLATRLKMPIETAQAAIDANTGKRPAEKMPSGGELDVTTAAHYENIYGSKSARRDEVLDKLDAAIDAIDKARADLNALPLDADPILWSKALDEKLAAEVTNRPIIEEYRNFPEEIPAYKKGAEVYHAVRQQARLADILRAARLNERRAYAKFVQARDDARRERADHSVRKSALSRGALNRALSDWVKALKLTSKAEHELIGVLVGK